MLYLFEYVKGRQPILDREKQIRPEINEKIVDNMASEILEFKLGYEFGSPISYVQRARKDIKSRNALFSFFKKLFTSDESKKEDLRVSAINEMMVEECKAAKDLMLAKDVKTCGVGYRLILPKKIKTGVSVFDLLVLNPMNTFVVYSNDAYREPILGVSYFPHIGVVNALLFCCSTLRISWCPSSVNTVKWRSVGKKSCLAIVIGILIYASLGLRFSRCPQFNPDVPATTPLFVRSEI